VFCLLRDPKHQELLVLLFFCLRLPSSASTITQLPHHTLSIGSTTALDLTSKKNTSLSTTRNSSNTSCKVGKVMLSPRNGNVCPPSCVIECCVISSTLFTMSKCSFKINLNAVVYSLMLILFMSNCSQP
jgi:hypothetical protein